MAPLSALALAFLAIQAAAHDPLELRRPHALHARQGTGKSGPAAPPAATPPAGSPSPAPAPPGPQSPGPSAAPSGSPIPPPPPAGAPNPGSPSPNPAAPPPGASTAAPSTSTPFNPASTLTATDPGIPPLASLVSNMPSGPSQPLSSTFAPGASAPVAGAPPLPTTTLNRSKYPAPTAVAPIDSPQVSQWLKELDNVKIPDIPPTTDVAQCASNAQAAADKSRCWWSCGGCTKDVDVHTCPTKLDWGVSFDDGPSPYTQKVLDLLGKNQLKSTFFVVGSSIYWNPSVLVEEYMAGHQICVHTWFHQHMTTLTNEQIVAELGWSREIIRDTIGVTPNCWRPPYGDIDDRVRAISLGMGLRPIIWTRNPTTGQQFDTNDWRIPGGQSTGPASYVDFQNILGNATMLDSGFIVLQHDLYEQTVDLAAYTLPLALSHNPKFSLKPIHQCLGQKLEDSYKETATNKDMPVLKTDWTGSFLTGLSSGTGSSSSGSGSGSSKSGGGSKQGNGAARVGLGAGTLFGGALVVLVASFI